MGRPLNLTRDQPSTTGSLVRFRCERPGRGGEPARRRVLQPFGPLALSFSRLSLAPSVLARPGSRASRVARQTRRYLTYRRAFGVLGGPREPLLLFTRLGGDRRPNRSCAPSSSKPEHRLLLTQHLPYPTGAAVFGDACWRPSSLRLSERSRASYPRPRAACPRDRALAELVRLQITRLPLSLVNELSENSASGYGRLPVSHVGIRSPRVAAQRATTPNGYRASSHPCRHRTSSSPRRPSVATRLDGAALIYGTRRVLLGRSRVTAKNLCCSTRSHRSLQTCCSSSCLASAAPTGAAFWIETDRPRR